MTSFLTSLGAGDWWVIIAAAACGIACAVPGCFLVLRRMSMLGDAISHAVLPGLAAAFIVTGSRDVLPMLIGALGAGVLTALLSAGLAKRGRVPEDAAMGVVFSLLFALGVLLISQVARDVDLDARCVLYGMIETVILDEADILGVTLPRPAVILGIAAVANVALAAVFYKELKIVSFDPYLATTMGISAALVHYGLLGTVAATTVAAFEAVGSILVVAMIIAPGATAHLLTDRLSRMLVIAPLLAVIAAFVGYVLALYWNTSVAGMISVVLGGQFALAALFAPRHGCVSAALRRGALALRIRREDILGRMFRAGEGTATAEPALPPGPLTAVAVWLLRRNGAITGDSLTSRGNDQARRVIRSHRLWEAYLNQRLGLPADHVHDPSERMEHFIDPALESQLRAQVEGETDPQGKKIPGG